MEAPRGRRELSRDDIQRRIGELIDDWFALQPPPDDDVLWAAIGPEEIKSAVEVLLSGRLTMGARVEEFEAAWAAWCGSDSAVMVNSGSSANLLATSAFASPATERPLGAGDEVIVPAICWSTSAYPALSVGAVPVFVDVDPVTFNLSPEAIEGALTERTRAVVPVHVLGNPCPMPEILSVARQHGLLVLEDCCEAHGASIGSRKVGTFGDLSTFSFFVSHHLTTVEGGIVCVGDSGRWRDILISQRAHGWIRGRSDEEEWKQRHPDLTGGWLFVEPGFNLRPMELQAALGRLQIARLDDSLARRMATWTAWTEAIGGEMSEHFELQQVLPGHRHSAFGLALVVREGSPVSRGSLGRFLGERGIFTRPLIAGNFVRHPVVERIPHRVASPDLAAADRVHDCGLMVGISPVTRVEPLLEALRDFVRAL